MSMQCCVKVFRRCRYDCITLQCELTPHGQHCRTYSTTLNGEFLQLLNTVTVGMNHAGLCNDTGCDGIGWMRKSLLRHRNA